MTANPTLLSMPLAQNGQKNVIPETQATAGDGLFSQSTGFPAETSLPLGAGGVAPSREDFNGLANLLGGVAFMAQKGFTFNYDATQDYYTGCVVIDSADGNRYECIADMTAGTIAPHSDTGNTYWKLYEFAPINSPTFTGTPKAPTASAGTNTTQIATTAFVQTATKAVGTYNHRDVRTTSGTYSAPVTGWYKITAKGGGGGGSGAFVQNGAYRGGSGGGEGGIAIEYKKITAGTSISYTIGAGGSGGGNTASTITGGDGGNTVVTINGSTITGGGGIGGAKGVLGIGGAGGSGTIPGASGGSGHYSTIGLPGGSGGGNGGGLGGQPSNTTGYVVASPTAGVNGGGGGGGGVGTSSQTGASGGSGYVWFEYYSAS